LKQFPQKFYSGFHLIFKWADPRKKEEKMKVRKKGAKVMLVAVLLLTLTIGTVLAERAVAEVGNAIRSYGAGTLTRDDVKAKIIEKYKEGTLTREDLRKVLTAAYNHGKLTRDDLRWVLGGMYKTGELTRADLKWILIEAYKLGELTRDDVRFILAQAYKLGELSRSDLKWILIEAYKLGELKRSDLGWILTHAYKLGELSRSDLKWIFIEAYKLGELRREDVRKILTAAYNHGELSRSDLKWILIEAYKLGELRKDDLKALLKAAYSQGELRKSDIGWLLKKAYEAGELTESDISVEEIVGIAVAKTPAVVPSIPDETKESISLQVEKNIPAENVLETTWVWVRYKYALIPIERHRIGMEAIIGYVKEIGKDTSTLEKLKDDFVSEKDRLETAAENNDRAQALSIIEEMKVTVASFKTEARKLVGPNVTEAKEVLKEALEQNKDYFDALLKEAREARRDYILEIFDLLVARADERIKDMEAQGIEVAELLTKLDEIREKRSDFISVMNEAIETEDRTAYDQMREEIKKEFKELRNLVKSKAQGPRIAEVLDRADAIISNAEARLDAAESRGIDVTVERAKLSEIKAMVDSAREKYNAGDYEGAIEELKSARDAFKSLREEARAKGLGGERR
jgi:hypothetical protein